MGKLLDRKSLAFILKETKKFLRIKAGQTISEDLADLVYRIDMAISYAECCINDIHGLGYNYQRVRCLLVEAMEFLGVDGNAFAESTLETLDEAEKTLKPETIKCIRGIQDSRERLEALGL